MSKHKLGDKRFSTDLEELIDSGQLGLALERVRSMLSSSALKQDERVTLSLTNAYLLRDLGRIDDSLAWFAQTRDLLQRGRAPKEERLIDILCLFELGRNFNRLNRFEEAVDALSTCYELLQNTRQGDISYLKSAVDLPEIVKVEYLNIFDPEDSPDSAIGQVLLARAHAEKQVGRAEVALNDLTKVIDNKAIPNFVKSAALLDRGALLFSLGKVEASIADFGSILTSAASFERQKCDATYNLAVISAEMGHLQQSSNYAKSFADSSFPPDALKGDLLIHVAYSLLRSGYSKRALELAEQAVALVPNADSKLLYAAAMLANERVEDALPVYDEVVSSGDFLSDPKLRSHFEMLEQAGINISPVLGWRRAKKTTRSS